MSLQATSSTPPPRPRQGLRGRTALVIGAGQSTGETIGIGRAAALRYGQDGADLVLVDRDPESLAATADQALRLGVGVDTLVADIGTEAFSGLLSELVDRRGPIDILHNGVGIVRGDDAPSRISEAAWNHILDVNLTGAWRACRVIVPRMRERGTGVVINVSSIAAVAAVAGAVAYKVSKAAVNALTQSLAHESAADGVRVNAVMPGLIATPMAVEGLARRLGIGRDEVMRQRDALSPTGAQGSAWDVAAACSFLASDEARFITGVILPVDGGQTLRIG